MASNDHNPQDITWATTANHNPSVAEVNAKNASIIAVGREVFTAGFWLSLIVGMREMAKIIVPVPKTISCQITLGFA